MTRETRKGDRVMGDRETIRVCVERNAQGKQNYNSTNTKEKDMTTLNDKLDEAYTFLHLAIHEKSGEERERYFA